MHRNYAILFQNLRTLIRAKMVNPKIYGTGEKVILSVEDDNTAYPLLEVGFNEVGGDYRLYRVKDGGEALAFLRRSGSL